MTNPLLTHALTLHAAGMSVIPIRPDGSKSPAVPWKDYTQTPADVDQINAWFTGTDHGLGVVCGPVSGQLEMVEIEGRAVGSIPQLRDLAHDSGLGELWDTITRGWVETSPSGGVHFHYRLTDADVPGNTKLARRPATPEELAANPGDRVKVLIETRGAGGQVVVAPTPGTHHPTGRPWTRLLGGPDTCPVITTEQREAFHQVLRTLDTMPAPERAENIPGGIPAPRAGSGDGLTPGDDYETRVDWTDILGPHGWTHVTTRGRTRYWRRPGKTLGFSATTGHSDDRDRLYVFTTSTDFTAETPYTKLGAHAVLEHGGDHSAAARALAAAGYGRPATGLRNDLAGIVAPDATPEAAEAPPAPPAAALTIAQPDRDAEPNEDNTALLVVDHHLDEIRYCPGRGTWLAWNGHRWTNDHAETIREHVRAIARRLPTSEGWATYTKRALSANGVTGILRLAQSDPRIVAPASALDARPYELNTPGGVVDLRTGTLRDPDPAALHTRSTTVTPDPHAPHPMWDRFLADTFAGDPAMTTYIQRLLGLSLVGVVLEQIFPFAFGAGANGKTTLLSVIQHLAGMGETGYALAAPASMLLATRAEAHPTELARLSGARLVVTSELEDNQRFAEAKIKLLTGKDTISGRFMRQDWFDFTPTHTLWLLANHQPEVRAGGIAFWRRIKLVSFEHTVPEEQRIPDLEDQLIAKEGPAILAWALEGARAYFATGSLAEPETVRAATDAYQRDQDTVTRFVDDCCQTGPAAAQHMKVRSGDLRQAYESWCAAEGEEPVNTKAMTLALRARFGVVPERSNTARYLAGIRLVEPIDDDSEASRDASPDGPDASRDEPPQAQLEGR